MTRTSTSEQAEMNAHEVAKFERIACGGIYEMVSTLRGLPLADGLDETDVRTAVACACLRIAALKFRIFPGPRFRPL
jgi:hypothetical protein